MTLKKERVFFFDSTNSDSLFASTVGASDRSKTDPDCEEQVLPETSQLTGSLGSETAALLGNKSCLWWR